MNLRPMEYGDLEMVREWRNHPDVRRNMYTHHEIGFDEHALWWDAADDDRLFIAGDKGGPLGVVCFSNYHPEHLTSDWAFYKAPDAPKGTGTQMERLAIEYAFATLGLEKLSCEVLSYNKPVYYLHRKHGFQLEGTFKKAHLFEGERHDIYRLALFKGDWKDALAQTMVGKEFNDTSDFGWGDVQTFQELTNDFNPVHGAPNGILPGMLTASLIPAVIAEAFPGCIYLKQELKFVAKAYPGDTPLQAVAKVVSQVGRKVWLETHVCKRGAPEHEVVLEGEALVLLPQSIKGDSNATAHDLR